MGLSLETKGSLSVACATVSETEDAYTRELETVGEAKKKRQKMLRHLACSLAEDKGSVGYIILLLSLPTLINNLECEAGKSFGMLRLTSLMW